MAVIGVLILVIAICDVHGMPNVELRDVINDGGPGNRVIGDVIDPSRPRVPWRPNNPSGPFGPIVVSKRDAEDGGDDDFQDLVDIIRETIDKAQSQISAEELLGRMSDLSELVKDILANEGNVSPQDIADVIDEVSDSLDEDDDDVDDLVDGNLKSDVEAVRLGLRVLKSLADKLEDELDSDEPEAPTVGAIGVIAEVVHTYVENTLEDLRKMLKAGSVSKRQVSLGVSKDLKLGNSKLTIDVGVSTKDFKTASFKVGFKIKL